MWAFWILRSYIDHCAHPLSDLVAERKFHGLCTLYIRDRILPFNVPRYSHKGLLGMSSRRDHAPRLRPSLVLVSGWEFVFDSDSEETDETGEIRGKDLTEGHSVKHRFQKIGELLSWQQERRWESRQLSHPTRWSVDGAKSVLCFLFAYLLDLHCSAFLFRGSSAQHKK